MRGSDHHPKSTSPGSPPLAPTSATTESHRENDGSEVAANREVNNSPDAQNFRPDSTTLERPKARPRYETWDSTPPRTPSPLPLSAQTSDHERISLWTVPTSSVHVRDGIPNSPLAQQQSSSSSALPSQPMGGFANHNATRYGHQSQMSNAPPLKQKPGLSHLSICTFGSNVSSGNAITGSSASQVSQANASRIDDVIWDIRSYNGDLADNEAVQKALLASLSDSNSENPSFTHNHSNIGYSPNNHTLGTSVERNSGLGNSSPYTTYDGWDAEALQQALSESVAASLTFDNPSSSDHLSRNVPDKAGMILMKQLYADLELIEYKKQAVTSMEEADELFAKQLEIQDAQIHRSDQNTIYVVSDQTGSIAEYKLKPQTWYEFQEQLNFRNQRSLEVCPLRQDVKPSDEKFKNWSLQTSRVFLHYMEEDFHVLVEIMTTLEAARERLEKYKSDVRHGFLPRPDPSWDISM
ncbi:hypothetical protein CAEBREN_06904 [Caenorhabditis brenneri]|uniref:Uncharacterized protein n=1 Tax=Caenorhabditis brenneri TaxID=135651 RepID=G0MSZ9_CAEBE|nr:hypothetical protein CAEBREN_06904 [Caenorhabditis brenneri]